MNKRISASLDWNRLLGFEQIAPDRETVRNGKLGSKVGVKVGVKIGVKVGLKSGLKTQA